MPTSQPPLPRPCPTHLWPQPNLEEHLCSAWVVREARGEAQQLLVVLSSFANLWGLLEPSGMIQTCIQSQGLLTSPASGVETQPLSTEKQQEENSIPFPSTAYWDKSFAV